MESGSRETLGSQVGLSSWLPWRLTRSPADGFAFVISLSVQYCSMVDIVDDRLGIHCSRVIRRQNRSSGGNPTRNEQRINISNALTRTATCARISKTKIRTPDYIRSLLFICSDPIHSHRRMSYSRYISPFWDFAPKE